MKKAEKKAKSPKPIIGKRKSQTAFFVQVEINKLKKIGMNNKSINFSLANKVFLILEEARKGEYQLVANERGRNADHEKLFLVTRKLILAESQRKKANITKEEERIVMRYWNIIKNQFLF